jgi:hypothetical protein
MATRLAGASIKPDIFDPPALYGKYRLEAKFQSGRRTQSLVLTVNASVAVPLFSGNALTLEYKEVADVTGFARISGNIGGGQIDFSTDQGVIVSGAIDKGPRESQSFVATGEWTIS